jgi:hypothetical protein
MPRFRVPVSGEDIEQAMNALEAAGLETTPDPLYSYGRPGGEEFGEARLVVVEADTPEAAKRRVQEVAPNYIVRAAEPVSEAR